jgi:hypothetical protein
MRFCASCGYDYQPGAASGVPAAGAAPVSPGPQTAHQRPIAPATIAVLAGGLLLVVGSFLPWVTASTVFGSISRSGVDGGGDGWITLVAGGVILLLGLATLRRPNRAANLLIAVAAAIAFVIFALDFSDVQSRITDLESQSEGVALGGVGIGLWLVALGAIVSFVSSLLRRSAKIQPEG